MRHIPVTLSRALMKYYLGPDHPLKIRIWNLALRTMGYPKLTIPFHQGKIALDLRDLVQREILVNGDYEPEVWEAISPYLQNGDVVYDIGAHVGSFSVKASGDSRVKRVLSFECCTPTLEQLRLNQKLNSARFEINAFAIGEKRGEMSLTWGEVENWGRSSLVLDRDSTKKETVPVRSLDELVEQEGFPVPNIIKMDIEGGEKSALAGATKTLARPEVRALVFESAQENRKVTDSSLSKILTDRGFRIEYIPRPGQADSEFGNFLATKVSL